VIRRLVIPRLSWVLVAGVAAFGAIAGFQLGGGTVPIVPTLSNGLLYAAAVGLFGLGIFGTLLRRPDIIGRIAPTFYVLAALLPLLRFPVPGISIIRFLPLALVAPVVYSLYRDAEPVPSHTRISRMAMFAAFATAASSLIANRAGTDYMRLLLMVGGIVLLVGAAPRAWSSTWRASVERAVGIAFCIIVVSTLVLWPLSESFDGDRLRGAFTSPNTLGALLALTTPIAASRSRFGLVHWTLALTLMIVSGTRGGLLALSVAAALMLLQRRRVFQLSAFVVISALVLASGVVRAVGDGEESAGVNTRTLIWNEVIDESQDSVLTGYGFGAIDDFQFSAETQRWAGTSPQSHNSWLDAWYEQGALGIIPWAFTLAVGLWTAVKAGPYWGATVIAGLVSATFESWMFAIGGGIGSLFWLVFGAASLLGDERAGGDHSSESELSSSGTTAESRERSPVKRFGFSLEFDAEPRSPKGKS